MKKRARLQTEERRAQLVKAGLELFSSRGYDDVSIDDIADAVGVSKGLLYHYFGGKRSFYAACVAEAADQLVVASNPDPAMPPGPAKALLGLNAYLDFVQARSRVFASLLRGSGADPEVAAIIAQTRERFADQFLEGSGITEERPMYRFAARTYVGVVEAASLSWLEDPSVTRPVLVLTLLRALQGIMRTAAKLDPLAGFEETPEMEQVLTAMEAELAPPAEGPGAPSTQQPKDNRKSSPLQSKGAQQKRS